MGSHANTVHGCHGAINERPVKLNTAGFDVVCVCVCMWVGGWVCGGGGGVGGGGGGVVWVGLRVA